jgi:hypothetical protein
MRLPLCSFAILFLLVAAPIGATEVFKCTDAAGKVSFTDRPCPKGAAAESVKIRAPDPNRPPGEVAASASRQSCVDIARPAWDLLPLEAGGSLNPEQRRTLEAARRNLQTECRKRLTSSSLAYDCREKLNVLTRATARAADPKYAADRDVLQAEFDRVCSEQAIRDDVERHLRDSGVADAPPAQSPPLN